MSDGGGTFHSIGPLWDAANSTIYSQPKLYHYEAGTSNDKDIWANEDKTGTLAQPFVAGTDGRFRFYADGDYKFIVKTSADVTIETNDHVRLTKDRSLEGEWDFGTSPPAATVNNQFKLFTEHEATTLDFEKLYINHGGGAGGAGPAWFLLLEFISGIRVFDDIALKGPIIDVRAYGALGDDSTDNATAIQTAANAIPATGGALYFPKGTYQTTTDIDVANKPIRIFGDGIGISVIKWVPGSDYGIDYNTTTSTDTLIVHDLSLHTTVAGAGDAINGAWTSASVNRYKCMIYNIELTPTIAQESAAFWTAGIVLSNAPNSHISRVSIQGKSSTVTDMTHGIYLTNDCRDSVIYDCDIRNTGEAILLDTDSSNCSIYDIKGTNNKYGVHLGFASAKPSTRVEGCKLISTKYGIFATNVTDSLLIDNIIAKESSSTEDFTGISIPATTLTTSVVNNSIREAGAAGTDVGISIDGIDNIVHFNYVENMDTGITCLTSSETNHLIGNRAENNLTADYVDSSTSQDNQWKNNWLDGIQSHEAAVSMTMPPVGDMYQITNESASTTSINSIAARPFNSLVTFYAPIGGEPTDIVWFLDKTGGTGTGNIYLVGSGDQQLNEGDLITMRCDGTNWHEIATIAATG